MDERAKWHDGKPVTAKDVTYSFETAFKFEFVAGGTLKAFIGSIDAVDERTVRFNMKDNYANLRILNLSVVGR